MRISEIIETEYNYWIDFMNHKVEFGLKSDFHTKAHCSRVLLFALVIAAEKGLGEREKNILGAASVFHDSRRHDDSLDVGHGLRAANYYKRSCEKNGLVFEQACYDIMAWHDRHDKEGYRAIGEKETSALDTITLYKIFKDADALDRYRFGPHNLDKRYLPLPESVQLCDFAKQVCNNKFGEFPSEWVTKEK